MKLVYCIAIVCCFIASAQAINERGRYNIEADLIGESSPIKLILEGMIENGANTELSTYIKVFNQVFPLLKAFTDAANPEKGNAVKTFRWEWCWRTGRGENIFCTDLVWNFVVGWRADQFHDEKRFYNLTVVPYAYMNAQMNISTQADPVKLSIGPHFQFVDFSAPLSFQMDNKDTLCYSGNLHIAPLTLTAGLGASFLECELMIPEDTHTCSWTEKLGARFFSAQLNDGYDSVLLERTCVHSG
jgi:hypothetical protein